MFGIQCNNQIDLNLYLLVRGLHDELVELDIGGSTFAPGEIRHLHPCDSLTRLDLSGTNITDGHVESLSKLQTLQNLNVSDTAITPQGIARLRGALPKCEIITNAPAGS